VIVAGWMKEVQSARLEAELGLENIAASPERRLSRDELAAAIREPGDRPAVVSQGELEPLANVLASSD
jgi:hypothetical protein